MNCKGSEGATVDPRIDRITCIKYYNWAVFQSLFMNLMSTIAVVKTGGKQYVVREGDVLKVEKLAAADGTIVFTDVLLKAAADGSSVELGQPRVKATVTGSVTKQGRAKKVLVVHYKAKVRYHKKYGHRQPFTEVKIDKL